MTIELPDVQIGSQPLTSGQARIAGISYITFMHEPGKHGVCINCTMEDLEHDFEMPEKLLGKAVAA